MEVPDGFPGADDISKVCKVNKVLYGLKQSPKAWYERTDTWLLSQGLYRSEYDPNLYHLIQDKKIIILLLYVDDLLITGDNFEEIARLKTELKKEFEMTDLGEASTYLSAKIMRGPHGIFISQKAYIRKLLKKFNMLECNSLFLPADPKVQLSKHMETATTNLETYRSIVGSLIYLMNTRPDISFAVGNVSRYMENSEIAHLQAAIARKYFGI